MDKSILFVKSDIDSTKTFKSKDLVSFHKHGRACFNKTTLDRSGIRKGMYARFVSVDFNKRVIRLEVEETIPQSNRSQYNKIVQLRASESDYCFVITTDLMFNHNIVLLGAFEFDVISSWKQIETVNSFKLETIKVIKIYF